MESSSTSSRILLSSYTLGDESIVSRNESAKSNIFDLSSKQQRLAQSTGVFTAYFKSESLNKLDSFQDAMAQLTEPHLVDSPSNNGVRDSHFAGVLGDYIGNENQRGEDFYDEIDQRMSRNSCEYPEQQAKFVNRWLDDMELSKSKSLVSSSNEWGNIIGIRGFPIGRNGKKSHRSRDGKLKFEYLKLRSENAKLKEQLNRLVQTFKKIPKPDYDINLLRFLKSSRLESEGIVKEPRDEAQLAQVRCTCDKKVDHKHLNSVEETSAKNGSQFNRLKETINDLNAKLIRNDQEHLEKLEKLKTENSDLRSHYDRTKGVLESEIRDLKEKVTSQSIDPINKIAIILKRENCRLKEMKAIDNIEFEALKENYIQLENRLRNLMEDQKQYDEEREKDAAELMVELCRLQVYQPKLEMILETERAIKVELQNRIEKLEEENDLLEGQLKDQSVKLSNEKSRTKMKDIVENEALQGELANWQEKYYRLKREKSDADELVRAAKSKVSSLDSKYLSDVELVKESHSREIENLKNTFLSVEKERTSLEVRLDETLKKLSKALSEEQRLTGELNELNRELAGKEGEVNILRNKLKEREHSLEKLRKQMQESELIRRNISDEYEKYKVQFERINSQVEDLRAKMELERNKFEEFKAEKEKELSQLRVSLNFEKYNKQVALKGIEKELRTSLKELEAMKYRFSRRLATQGEPEVVFKKTNRVPYKGLSKDSCPGKERKIDYRTPLEYPKAKEITNASRGDT